MKNKGFEGFFEDEIKLIENKYSEKKQRRVIMENNENNKELEEFRKFNIRDTKVLSRLLSIRAKLVCERNIDMGAEELLSFLTSAMNYGNMSVWLIRQKLKGIKLSLNDKLKKFFELETDEEILILYDIEQDHYEKNVEYVRNVIGNKTGKQD